MKADELEPQSAESQIRLGGELQNQGNLEAAALCYQRAISLKPRDYVAYHNLGTLFASLKDFATALIFFNAAVEVNPNIAGIHHSIAHVYLEQEEIARAITSYRQAIALQPQASYYNHLGNALRIHCQYAEAEAYIRKALSLDPTHAEAYVNLGFLLFQQQGINTREVIAYYREAIRHKPGLAQAHVNLSQALLQAGEFHEGWQEQEWRWQWDAFPSPKRHFCQPRWRGEQIRGLRILLHAEQGFGDTLQFLRYVPMVAARGARIVLEVHPELKRLAESISAAAEVVSRGDTLPYFDYHCPLLSLPLAFATDLGTIPSSCCYLQSNQPASGWIKPDEENSLRVGLAWAGGTKNLVDRRRSLALSALDPLWEIEGISFYALQHGVSKDAAAPEPCRFRGTLPQAGDFADTAAALSCLDLVITVDTAVAHLAGALGTPVWILLPGLSDWRWLLDRDDSPWYPSARLFRQGSDMAWSPVIDRVVTELTQLAATAKAAKPTRDTRRCRPLQGSGGRA